MDFFLCHLVRDNHQEIFIFRNEKSLLGTWYFVLKQDLVRET